MVQRHYWSHGYPDSSVPQAPPPTNDSVQKDSDAVMVTPVDAQQYVLHSASSIQQDQVPPEYAALGQPVHQPEGLAVPSVSNPGGLAADAAEPAAETDPEAPFVDPDSEPGTWTDGRLS